MAEPKPKRPFWLHQAAEYLLGVVLVAQGLQSPTPTMPAIAGAVMVCNAAMVRGPLGAFRTVGRGLHRVLDYVVVAVVGVMAAQPFVSVEGTTRLTMGVIAVIHAFVSWQTNYAEKVRTREPISAADGRGAEIGRMAGRLVGDGVNAIRRRRRG